MTGDVARPGSSWQDRSDGSRRLPDFFLRWRRQWGEQGAAWIPADYLNRDEAIGPAIAAGWLFNPSTVEYRDGVFIADRFSAETVNEWFARYPYEPARIEAVVNAVVLYDFFVNCELEPYEDALPGLAADLGACWFGVLSGRYPDRRIHVEVNDGTESGTYGPSVTFWTERKSA
jgi:hypothetical protein